MKLLEVIKGDFAKLATLVRKTKMLNEIVIETLRKVCRDVALYEFKKGERLFKQGAHEVLVHHCEWWCLAYY